MIEILFYILIGCGIGFAASLVPGLNSNNLTPVLLGLGIIASQQNFVVVIIAIEISYSFFEFLAPILFGISGDMAALAIDQEQFFVVKGLVEKAVKTLVMGGLVGIALSLPLFLIAQRIYPVVYSSLSPIASWIMIVVCAYMFWREKTWKGRLFSLAIFILSGMLGLLIKDSGFLPTNYMMPIFIGLFSFSHLLSREREEKNVASDLRKDEKVRILSVSFLAAAFASLIPKMKKSQAAAIAMQAGGIRQNEEVLLALSSLSSAFATLSILVLGSTGIARNNIAYDIQDLFGAINTSQTLLFLGTIAISTCLTACMMLALSKPLSKNLNRINRKYMKAFGFCLGCALIVCFTGWQGVLLASVSTCIGLLSKRLKIRSTHLMGVLILPSILPAII